MTEEPPPLSDIRGGLFCDEPVCSSRSNSFRMCSVSKAQSPASFTGKAQSPRMMYCDDQ